MEGKCKKINSLVAFGCGIASLTMASFLFLTPTIAHAGPYLPVLDPVAPHPGNIIPPVERVPSKEYSHEFDKDANNINDSTQNIMFDGKRPGGVEDTFDYDGQDVHNPNIQVDAIANHEDALFSAVIHNRAAALFSLRTGPNIQGQGADVGFPIYVESIGGNISGWADKDQVDQHGVINLDGLEVWGPEGSDDADRFSYFNPTNITGVEVWTGTDGSTGSISGQRRRPSLTSPTPTPYIYTSDLAAAFGDLGLEPYLDIDALMAHDLNGSVETWDPGDEILFSLWPNAQLDPVGDAVWYWKNGQTPELFNHGGHDWYSGWLGTNIDALEAVATPEPGTLILLGTGLAGLAGRMRKKKQVIS